MNTIRHTILGIFFFATVAILGFVTIYLGDFHPLHPPTIYAAWFKEVDGIGPGDPVLVYGFPRGRVQTVAFTPGNPPPEKRLRVTFALDEPVTLKKGYQIMIGSQSLLGGREIDVNVGDGELLTTQEINDLYGTSVGNVMRMLTTILDENAGPLHRGLSSLANMVESIDKGERSILGLLLEPASRDNVTAFLLSARSVADKLDHGEGSFAKAINDPALHDAATGFFAEGKTLLTDAREKPGALNTLIYDTEFNDQLKSGMKGLSDTAGRLGRGEGLLGKATMPESEETWNNLKSTGADLAAMTADLRAGRGAFGRFLNDPEVEKSVVTIIDKIASSTTDIAALVDGARRGRGVVGWLFADDQARRTLDRIVDQVGRAVEDAREAAPVSSIASFLFGSL